MRPYKGTYLRRYRLPKASFLVIVASCWISTTSKQPQYNVSMVFNKLLNFLHEVVKRYMKS